MKKAKYSLLIVLAAWGAIEGLSALVLISMSGTLLFYPKVPSELKAAASEELNNTKVGPSAISLILR